ncbi:MAG: hypothetical protein ACO1RX_23030 [Candidatus Sericytochromatia bacterium]
MVYTKFALTLALCLLLTACDSAKTESLAEANKLECRVSAEGIGLVKLGMTLEAARKALPGATFTRTSDGDGVALVEVKLGSDSLMQLYAEEADPEAPIDWNRTIQQFETFHSACHTQVGIHPGSLITDAEKAYGKTQRIGKSEIESREYITFANMPARIGMRIDASGIFLDGTSETTQFRPDGKIFSLIVSAPDGDAD